MEKPFSLVKRPGLLRKKLEDDILANAGFLWRVFHDEEKFKIYATKDMASTMAIQENGKRVMFAGDWSDIDVPLELLPKDSISVSSSPLPPIEFLKEHYSLDGEWPCWYFLAPDGFGPGEWDSLGPLTSMEASYVAPFWELGGEEHIIECIQRFDSACVRVDGKPVSWCGLHFEMDGVGNLGFAHTIEDHRRKGLARIVTKALVNRMAARGARATAHVIKGNAASIATCKSMGFEVVGEIGWADFGKRK